MKNKILLYLSILLVVVWMVIIYFFSDASSDKSNDGSKGILKDVITFICSDKSNDEINTLVNKLNKPFRKFAHASVYFVLANFVNSVVCTFMKNKLFYCNLISLIICFLYACSDEWHQTFISHRTGQFSDVLIDMFGAILGSLIFDFIYKYIVKKKYLEDKKVISDK